MPRYEAVYVPALIVDTARELTVKLRLDSAGTVTLDGLLTPAAVAASETTAPPDGAEPVNVTFAVAVWHDPIIVLRVSARPLSTGGTTVRTREMVTSPYVAEMVTLVGCETTAGTILNERVAVGS